MLRFNDDAGPAGNVSSSSPAPQFSDASSSAPTPSRRGRVRNADFGMDDAFRRGDNIQPLGVGYRMVTVTNPDGSAVIPHKGTIEKRAEFDPDTAAWIVRGAELITCEGKSPIDVPRLFNEH